MWLRHWRDRTHLYAPSNQDDHTLVDLARNLVPDTEAGVTIGQVYCVFVLERIWI